MFKFGINFVKMVLFKHVHNNHFKYCIFIALCSVFMKIPVKKLFKDTNLSFMF